MNLKEPFLKRMHELLQEDMALYLDSLTKESTRLIQLNTQKIDDKTWENIIDFPVQKEGTIPHAYTFDQDKIGLHPFHQAGLFYVQEPSAMLVPYSIAIKKDAKILDLCASPGGKTNILSDLVPDGMIIANEVNINRCKTLLSNIERLGKTNVIVTNMTAEALSSIYTGYFDVILLDAPCSGEGMFRKDEEAQKNWSEEKVLELSHLQKELIQHCHTMLKEKGMLIYSTCTFAKEEDEENVVFAIDHLDMKLLPTTSIVTQKSLPGKPIDQHDLQNARRCYPHIFGEGQFIAVLQKTRKEQEKKWVNAIRPLPGSLQKEIASFIKENLNSFPYPIYSYKDKIIVLPKELEIPSLRSLSTFVTLGTMDHGRFIPHHQFSRSYGSYFQRKHNLTLHSVELSKYLEGYELETTLEDGWCIVTCENFPLGLGKVKNHRLKNHYPKGLRSKKIS